MSGRRWTSDEIAILEDRYGTGATAALAKALNRTPSAVHQRALKLGLVQEEDLSLTAVREILGLGSDYRLIYTWLREGRLIRRQKYGDRRSLIREADLIAFLRDNDHPLQLEHAFHAGTVDEVRKRGVRWVIPESILPRLVAGRRRFTEDTEHRRQVRVYDRLQARGTLRAMQRARPRLRKAS